MQTKEIAKRNNQIYKKYLNGITLKKLGKENNISSERIHQICDRLKYIDLKKRAEVKTVL